MIYANELYRKTYKSCDTYTFINEGDVILLEKALSQPFLCYTLKGDILGNRYSDIEESPCSHSLRWL